MKKILLAFAITLGVVFLPACGGNLECGLGVLPCGGK